MTNAVVMFNCTTNSLVTSIRKWRDDETRRVTKILILVLKHTANDFTLYVVVFLVESKLRQPLELTWVADLLVD